MTRKTKLPNLPTNVQGWAKARTEYIAVTITDIVNIFGVSRRTRQGVVDGIYEYCDNNNKPIYQAGSRRAIPTSLLFEMYGYEY